MGWRLDNQPINYRAVYTGVIDIRGTSWGRMLDNIGIALGYMYGGNTRIIRTRLAEAYYRMVITPNWHLPLISSICGISTFQYQELKE